MHAIAVLLFAQPDSNYVPGQRCLTPPDPPWRRLRNRPSTRLIVGNWREAQVVAYVAGILIRDKLATAVSYVGVKEDAGACTIGTHDCSVANNGSSLADMYGLIANHEADLALTVWPSKFESSIALEAKNKLCPTSSNFEQLCLQTIGEIGYKARSGWFVPTKHMSPDNAAKWSQVKHLFTQGAKAELLKANELPVTNLCGPGKGVPDDSRTHGRGGVFSCEHGSWTLNDSPCCSRLDTSTGRCGSRPPCIALIADSPLYDQGFNEAMVADLAKPVPGSSLAPPGIEIVYGGVEPMVKVAERDQRPVLVYSWEPRQYMMRTKRFVRLTLRDYYYCEYFGSPNASNRLVSVSGTSEETGLMQCDYPVERVEKIAHFTVARDQEVAHLVRSLRLDTSAIMSLLLYLERALNAAGSKKQKADVFEEAACEWLQKNLGSWAGDTPSTQWALKPNIYISTDGMAFAVACCLFVFLWLFVVEPNFLRCAVFKFGPAEDDSAFRDIRGTTCWGYDVVGLMRSKARARKLSWQRAMKRATAVPRVEPTINDHDHFSELSDASMGSKFSLNVFRRFSTKHRGSVKRDSVKRDSVNPGRALVSESADMSPRTVLDGSVPQVTFGQEKVTAHKQDATARLAIVRRDECPQDLAVTVLLVDLSAKLGRDFAGITLGGEHAIEGATPAQSVSFVIKPGQRVSYVVLHILERAGFQGFSRLNATLVVNDTSSEATVSPVAVTRLTIVDNSTFPNGYSASALKTIEKRLQLSEAMEDVRIPNATHMASSESVDSVGSPSSTMAPPIKRWATGGGAGTRDSTQSVETPRGDEESGSIHADLLMAFEPVKAYLREALRWCWAVDGFPVPMPVTFALFQIMAQFTNLFLTPIIKEYWIDSLSSGQLSLSVMCAMGMVLSQLINFRANLIFSGRWDVQRQLQMLLVRKYLSLDVADLDLLWNAEEKFRTAIVDTAPALSNDCYLGAHNAVASLWGLVFGVCFIIRQLASASSGNDDLGYGLGLGAGVPVIILFVFGLFAFRAKKTWKLFKQLFDARVIFQGAMTFMLGNPSLVRGAEQEDDMANTVNKAITETLWGSDGMWLYNYLTEWWMKLVLYSFIYGLWASGTILTDPASTFNLSAAQLIVLVGVLESMAGNLFYLEKEIGKMFTSGAMVIEVAQLLNFETRAQALVHAQRRGKRPGQRPGSSNGGDGSSSGDQISDAQEAEVRAMIDCFDLQDSSNQGCVQIEDLVYSRADERPLFNCCNLYRISANDEEAKLSFLPSGGLIGVRVDERRADRARANVDMIFMKILAEELLPDQGLANVIPTLRVQFVQGASTREVFRGTLEQNLLYGGSDHSNLDDRDLWRLCRYCGINECFIGKRYRVGWSQQRIEPLAWSTGFTRAFLENIAIVRALLRRPDVLLLHNVGMLWEEREQNHLIGLIRAFLDRSIDKYLGNQDHKHVVDARTAVAKSAAAPAAAATTPVTATLKQAEAIVLLQALARGKRARKLMKAPQRTVLWCADDALLQAALTADDFVLTIESSSRCTLKNAKGIVQSAPAARNTKIKRSIASAAGVEASTLETVAEIVSMQSFSASPEPGDASMGMSMDTSVEMGTSLVGAPAPSPAVAPPATEDAAAEVIEASAHVSAGRGENDDRRRVVTAIGTERAIEFL